MEINFQKYNFGNEEKNQQKIKNQQNKIKLFTSCANFLLCMVEGNDNKDCLQHILHQIQCDQMFALINKIYQERIYSIHKYLVLEIHCQKRQDQKHKRCNKNECNESVCKSGYCTDYDIYLYEIGFKMFIVYCYLYEKFPDDHSLDTLTKLFDSKNREFDIFKVIDQTERKKIIKLVQNKKKKVKQTNQNQIGQGVSEIKKIFSKKYQSDNQNYVLPCKFDTQFKCVKNLPTSSKANTKLQSDTQRDDKQSIFQIVLEAIIKFESVGNIARYYDFFTNQIGITEVFINNKVQLIYFQKPFCSNFLSHFIKKHLIFESDKESDEERLLFLLDNFEFYHKQMIYKQQWYKYKISWFLENWRIIKDIQYFFLLLIVFLQLFFLEGSIGDNSEFTDLDYLTRALTVIQLILTAWVLIGCGIERYQISINRYRNALSWRKIQYLKEQSGYRTETRTDSIKKFFSKIWDTLNPENYENLNDNSRGLRHILLIIRDFENFYHLCYLCITIAAFFLKGPLVYGILLLDVVKRSSSLKQIIKSITQNLKNIFIFTYLGVIVMYIYGIGGHYYFKADFDEDEKAYNDTFISTVTSVINMGLRNGGGISESLKNVQSYSNPENHISTNYYWGRYFFDLSFFIIINMLFIQIIFGIILDAFEELRKEQDKIFEEVLNKCFVCSMSRSYIEIKTEGGWYQHIYLYHNVYHLVFFLIYISTRDDTQCNYIEKYVKKQIQQRAVDFIPKRMCSEMTDQEPLDDDE